MPKTIIALLTLALLGAGCADAMPQNASSCSRQGGSPLFRDGYYEDCIFCPNGGVTVQSTDIGDNRIMVCTHP